MTDLNSVVLDVASWVDPRDWRAAGPMVRDRYLARIADEAKAAKLRQVLRGIGGDGRPLEPRIRPRADGARGKPLSPHGRDSRSYKWARASISRARGTVTLWWSHGWGRILGYHARGQVIGTYLRNVIDFPPGVLAWLKGVARKLLAALAQGRHPGAFAPPPLPSPEPVAVPFRLPPLAAAPFAAEPIDLSAVTAGAGGMEALRRVLGGAGLVIDRGDLVRTTPSFIRRR